MPFTEQTPRQFTRANIEAHKPEQMGCYGLSREREWVYVGKGDIRARLLDHLNGDNPCIMNRVPTHWVDAVTEDYDNLEEELILELNPTCNKRVG